MTETTAKPEKPGGIDWTAMAAELEPGTDLFQQILKISPKETRKFLRQLSRLPLDVRAERWKLAARSAAMKNPGSNDDFLTRTRLEVENERRISLGQRLIGSVVQTQIRSQLKKAGV
jgi:hypothetical protein